MTHARVVVGVDGSPNSDAALRFAITEARLRGAVLEVVMAWTLPFTGSGSWDLTQLPDPEPIAASHERLLETMIADVDTEGLEVRPIVVQDDAASHLSELAEGADLLVVGRRGHGGFVGLLLGSVSQKLAAHAPCPVAFVPADED
ncbi:MAG TPA: universal stress protein [Acidimicrobiales bacterium]|nr:universal stress protein [Acidimicrobiales bacterium]